jgi:hypothetical protein
MSSRIAIFIASGLLAVVGIALVVSLLIQTNAVDEATPVSHADASTPVQSEPILAAPTAKTPPPAGFHSVESAADALYAEVHEQEQASPQVSKRHRIMRLRMQRESAQRLGAKIREDSQIRRDFKGYLADDNYPPASRWFTPGEREILRRLSLDRAERDVDRLATSVTQGVESEIERIDNEMSRPESE